MKVAKERLRVEYYKSLDKIVKLNMEIVNHIFKINSLELENGRLKEELKDKRRKNDVDLH